MNFKEKFNQMKEKVKNMDWKKFIGTKAFITVGCVTLVCIAVLVSTLVSGNEDVIVNEEGNRVLGNTLLVDSSASENLPTNENDQLNGEDVIADENKDFFAMAILNRTQVRDNALEVLNEIASNPDTLPDAKEQALSSIASIADEMSAEANIETLIQAKGISQCVAVISGDTCSIIVNRTGLVPDELTQITDIVVEQTGIPVANITVVEAKK